MRQLDQYLALWSTTFLPLEPSFLFLALSAWSVGKQPNLHRHRVAKIPLSEFLRHGMRPMAGTQFRVTLRVIPGSFIIYFMETFARESSSYAIVARMSME